MVGKKIACYARVSTDEQSLDRQLTSTTDYARDRLGADPDSIQMFRDKSTGTSTARSGYQSMMQAVDDGSIDAVVAHQVSRVARSISDLELTAERLRSSGVALHIINEGLQMTPDSDDPYQKALFQMLGVFAELEASITRQNIREGIAARQESEEYSHGPAPLGFEKDDGRLVEGGDYQRVCTVVDMVARGDMSVRSAAAELDTSRRTVRRSIDERASLYGL